MRSISACVRPSAFRVTAKRAPISSNEVGSGIVSSACPVGCSSQKPISRLDVSSVACRRCLRPPLLSIPLVGELGREAASPHQALTLSPLRQGFFRAAGSALRHRNQLLGSKFCRGLPPNSGARLLVIDPLLVRSDVRRQAPLRRLSPARVGGFFCAKVLRV